MKMQFDLFSTDDIPDKVLEEVIKELRPRPVEKQGNFRRFINNY